MTRCFLLCLDILRIHTFNDARTLCVVNDLHIRVGIMIDYNCLQWKTLVLFVHLGGKTMKTCEVLH